VAHVRTVYVFCKLRTWQLRPLYGVPHAKRLRSITRPTDHSFTCRNSCMCSTS
jgi:hypothetical protein